MKVRITKACSLFERLYQVTAPHFCAGIVLSNSGFVTEAAPILKWTIGKSENYLADYFKRKGWKVAKVDSHTS